MAESLGKALTSESWLSPQQGAYALWALSHFIGHDEATKGIQGTYRFEQGPEKTFSTPAYTTQIPLPLHEAQAGRVSLTHTGNAALFVKTQLKGILVEATAVAAQQNLRRQIDYFDMAGNRLDPAKFTQGTDFMVQGYLPHPRTQGDYREMAWLHHFPAWWQIKNATP